MIEVGPQLGCPLFVDDIGHVSVHEVGMVPAFGLGVEEGFLLFADDADLSVIVDDVEMGGLFERAEGHVEDAFEIVVPG